MYQDVIEHLARVEDAPDSIEMRRRAQADTLDVLRHWHTTLPEDYLAYLEEVGSGLIRKYRFSVFSAFIEPSYFLGHEALNLDAAIVCFGMDAASGDPSGFLLRDWRIVEIDQRTLELRFVPTSFSSYIRERLHVPPRHADSR
jgi:hypothetical protein